MLKESICQPRNVLSSFVENESRMREIQLQSNKSYSLPTTNLPLNVKIYFRKKEEGEVEGEAKNW